VLIFCGVVCVFIEHTKINKLKFENAAMTKATTGFVKLMHDKTEDLFQPCVPWSWGRLSGIKIQNPETKNLTKINYKDIKLKSHTDQEILDFQNVFKDEGFTYGLKIENYNTAISSMLTPKMQEKLEKSHYIAEYNGELFTFDGGCGCMNFFLCSDFIPKEITGHRLAYTVQTKYATSAESEKKFRQEGKIEKQDLKSTNKDFVLIKTNDEWFVDEFETSRYAVPD
jgi:hypothetical protein